MQNSSYRFALYRNIQKISIIFHLTHDSSSTFYMNYLTNLLHVVFITSSINDLQYMWGSDELLHFIFINEEKNVKQLCFVCMFYVPVGSFHSY